MTDCPYRYSKRRSSEVFAEANRRGLLGGDAEQTWIYMFHDIYGVAHFKHVDGSGYLLMHPKNQHRSKSAKAMEAQNE